MGLVFADLHSTDELVELMKAAGAGRLTRGRLMDEVRDSFRSSTWGWLRGTLAGIGTVLLGIAGVAVMIGKAGDWGAWPLAATGFAVLIVLWKWLQNLGARYDLTEQRLVIRRGIFFKSIDEIELYRIKDVRMDFTLLGQWAGIGTVCLTSSDETTRVAIWSCATSTMLTPDARTSAPGRRGAAAARGPEIDMVHEDI
jgi:membrane protein YdbS with pleckstrin-like domain